jgi:HD-GYP domain-containing protein (c-di-GMP phosphodiesterase class II)
MTTDRTYRPALPVSAAVAELSANAGEQFDPRVVKIVVGLVDAGELAVPLARDQAIA